LFGFCGILIGFVATNVLNAASGVRPSQACIDIAIGVILSIMALAFPFRLFVSVSHTKRRLAQQAEQDLKQVSVQA
jgi:hypothetical protein